MDFVPQAVVYELFVFMLKNRQFSPQRHKNGHIMETKIEHYRPDCFFCATPV